MNLRGYVIATALFPERIVWIPLFYRDYTFHGFASVAAYLDHKDNYRELLVLQLFSVLIMSGLYLALGVGGYFMSGLTKYGKTGVGHNSRA